MGWSDYIIGSYVRGGAVEQEQVPRFHIDKGEAGLICT